MNNQEKFNKVMELVNGGMAKGEAVKKVGMNYSTFFAYAKKQSAPEGLVVHEVKKKNKFKKEMISDRVAVFVMRRSELKNFFNEVGL